MNDPYGAFIATGFGRSVATKFGLPRPVRLRRFDPDDLLCDPPVLVTGPGLYATAVTADLESRHGVTTVTELPADGPIGALVIDLSTIHEPSQLELLRALGSAPVKRLARNARVVVIGGDPTDLHSPTAVATQQALTGAVRSIAKELRAGATANLIQAPADAHPDAVLAATAFFLSGRSAYISGQPLRLNASKARPQDDEQPLANKVAVVTGAARGIGAAIVASLARDGAMVVGVDIPAAGEALADVVNAVGGTALMLDVTDPEAGARILEHCTQRHGGLDIVVHNAGITRDKLFVNTDAERWSQVIDVNLRSILAMNEIFLGTSGLTAGGRIVCLSSQSGIAGNRGQTNYAASKAGVIGLVSATAGLLNDREITINAVAPGFIETEMTARIPLATREVARRLNSLQQGGLPVDVADTIGFLASPAAQAVNGQTLRVCGQSMVGA